MSRPDTEVVAEQVRAANEHDLCRLTELLAENYFARLSSGQIYAGSTGFANWVRDAARRFQSRRFEASSITQAAPEFVLLAGVDHRTLADGTREAVPGVWLYHVRDERINALVYFRTEREALASLAGPGREELPADVVERMIDAFNGDDYVEIVSGIHRDYRFDSAIIEPGNTRRGLDALIARLVEIKSSFRVLVVQSPHLTELGEGFVLVEGVIRSERETRISRRRAVWLALVEEGRVREFLSHPDAESAKRAAGARMQPGTAYASHAITEEPR